MIKLNMFKCEYCGKIGEKEDIEEHEECNCIRNPKFKPCESCKYAYHGINDPDSIYCIKKSISLSPIVYNFTQNCHDHNLAKKQEATNE